jgi:hypothetical protein
MLEAADRMEYAERRIWRAVDVVLNPSAEEAAEVRALKRQVKTLTARVEHMAETGNLRVMLRALERQDAKKKQTELEE